MDKNKGSKIPAQIRVNLWLGLATVEKKFNAYAEGTYNVFAELVNPFIFRLYVHLYCIVRNYIHSSLRLHVT